MAGTTTTSRQKRKIEEVLHKLEELNVEEQPQKQRRRIVEEEIRKMLTEVPFVVVMQVCSRLGLRTSGNRTKQICRIVDFVNQKVCSSSSYFLSLSSHVFSAVSSTGYNCVLFSSFFRRVFHCSTPSCFRENHPILPAYSGGGQAVRIHSEIHEREGRT